MQSTPEQQAFIDEVGDTTNSIILSAVAGSGKTTTLLKAAQRLNPRLKIIALAFNKNIAEELQKKFPSYVTCKTLNGIGHQVWMSAHGKKNLDSRKMGDLVTKWLAANIEPEERKPFWIQLRTITVGLKAGGFVPQALMSKTYCQAQPLTPEVVEGICDANEIVYVELLYHAAQSILMSSISEAYTSRIDFDDQIYMSTYFAEDQAWPRHDLVMVDETQDLSRVQHDMIERLGAGSRLIVVGDERQAIYGWRGASCRSMQELEERFNLKRMPLTVSFRCPEAIIREAQRVVPHIQHHKPGGIVNHWRAKHYFETDSGERWEPGWYTDDFIAGSVVLCRNNAPLIKLGFSLVAQGRPVFFANRDVGAGLKKIIESLPMSGAELHEQLSDWFEAESDKLRAKSKFQQLDVLEDKYEALKAIMSGTKARTKGEVLRGIDKLFLREPSPSAIELSTIHKSKGKEWPHVYFLNEDLLPGKWIKKMAENETPGAEDLLLQEDNLRYVALTRALETLTYVPMERDMDIYSRKSWAEEQNSEGVAA